MIFTRLTNDDGMKIKERTFFPLFLHVLEKRKKTKKGEKKKVQKKKKEKACTGPGVKKKGTFYKQNKLERGREE